MAQETVSSTKSCPKCAESIATNAKVCKHCKADLRNWFVRHYIVSIILGLIVFGSIISAFSKPSTSTTTTATSNSAATNTAPTTTASDTPPAPQEHKAGEDVKVGQVRWKLVEAKDLGDTLKKADSNYPTIADDKKANANSKFVQVTMEVENLDTSMKSVGDLNIMDSKNRKFTSASDTSEWVPQDKQMFLLSNLNPNVPQQFTAIYEVPKDATGLKVQVGDLSLFGSDKADISLGL